MITELMCLATAVFFEAGNQEVDGKYAVAEVIMNRKDSRHYPDTICGVVKDDRGPKAYDCQFSFWCDGKTDEPSKLTGYGEAAKWAEAQEVAKVSLAGNSPMHMPDVVLYHADYTTPYWAKSYVMHGKIGSHVFYTGEMK